jgi:hypothetical protein
LDGENALKEQGRRCVGREEEVQSRLRSQRAGGQWTDLSGGETGQKAERYGRTKQPSSRLACVRIAPLVRRNDQICLSLCCKTSELLLAAGIVISTANFLTDGAVMSHNIMLSDAWSWAQALAIESSLGIVLLNAFHSFPAF